MTARYQDESNISQNIIYVYRKSTGKLEAIGQGYTPRVSDNGEFVAYKSGTSLVGYDVSDKTEFIIYNANNTGLSVNIGGISSDGRFISFYGGGSHQVYDRVLDSVTELFEAGAISTGVGSSRLSTSNNISGNGRYISAFQPVNSTTAGYYIYDRVQNQGRFLDFDYSAGSFSSLMDMSFDGRFVVFTSSSDKLTPDDTNGKSDVFRYDTLLEEISRVSEGRDSDELGFSGNSSISNDGALISFLSSTIDQSNGSSVTNVYYVTVN